MGTPHNQSPKAGSNKKLRGVFGECRKDEKKQGRATGCLEFRVYRKTIFKGLSTTRHI